MHEQASHTYGGPNVYADLGYRDPDRMLIKAQLVNRIAERLAENAITKNEAAILLGISQSELSRVFRGQFRSLPEYKLMRCLALPE